MAFENGHTIQPLICGQQKIVHLVIGNIMPLASIRKSLALIRLNTNRTSRLGWLLMQLRMFWRDNNYTNKRKCYGFC